MAKYKHIEDELQRMREAKEAIERQLAELQAMIDRTAQKVAREVPSASSADYGDACPPS